LEEVGFNGHFLILNGGFPNPTGKEMKYVGVPYCFKIFMMMEAEKLGFEKVIWIDAACYAVNNVDTLFDQLDEYDAVFRAFHPNCFAPDTCINNCFPKTIELLSSIVKKEIKLDVNVNSIVFGLNVSSWRVKSLMSEYVEMVSLGLPFLTAFPEENVLASMMNKCEYKYMLENIERSRMLYINECYQSKETAKCSGYKFVQREYK